MINPDSVNSLAAAVLPARSDSGNGEQKRAAWMLQMERALLAANQVRVTPDTAQAGMQSAPPLPGKQAENEVPREKSRVPQESNAAVAGASNVPVSGHVTALVHEANQAAAETGAAPAVSALQATGGRAVDAARNPDSVPLQTAQMAKTGTQADGATDSIEGSGAMPGGSGRAGDTGSAQQNGLPLPGMQAVPVSAMTALAAGLLPVLNPYQSLQPEGQSVAAHLAVAGVRAASPAGMWGLSQAASQGKPLTAHAGDGEAAEAPATGGEAPEAEPFAERQLHLYQGADGVQAWIRDADLSQMRAQLVAQALNNELNAAGLKLKTLTVNGRKLDGSNIGTGGAAEDGADALADFAMPEISANRAVQN